MKRKSIGPDALQQKGQRSISSFFCKAATAPQQGKKQSSDADQSRKRQKPTDGVVVIDIDGPSASDAAAPAHAPSPSATGTAACGAGHAAIPAARESNRHKKAQAKLSKLHESHMDDVPTPATTAAAAAATATKRHPAPKYTPLEQQVVALKAAHPGVLLLVEVGYKMRMFGEDAQVAAQELGICCFPDHNFMTASFPVPRLPIHVRRLVAAGHKVGVVRQVESAALKAVSDNKSAPFTRALTGLFTAATLEAAEKADKLDEASAMEVSQELESLLAGKEAASAANYILVVAEQQQQQGGSMDPAAGTCSPAAAAAAAAGGGGGGKRGQGGAPSAGLVGVLAIDVGSGDVAYGLCSSSSYSSGDGSSCPPLDAVLLSLSPADIVVCEPLSEAAERLLSAYMAGTASRKCRLERQQKATGKSGASSSSNSSGGGGSAGNGSYLDAARLAQLVDFYSGSSSSSGSGSSSNNRAGASNGSSNAATTAGGGGAAAAGNESDDQKRNSSSSSSSDVGFILSLPEAVLVCLAGALQYLTPFGLSHVLRGTSSFRVLAGVGRDLLLEGNVLRQLEVLTAGEGSSGSSVRGSLLHLLDRCSTAAGSRLLRRWLTRPLADRATILDRQQAVQVLLSASSSGATDGSGGGSSSEVLSRLPGWLSGLRLDLERLLARVSAGTAAPAEAVGLWNTVAKLPSSLGLPLLPKAAAAALAGDTVSAEQQQQQQHVDLAALSAAVPSRLLVSLLSAAAGPAAVDAAVQVLGWLDAKAAGKNDYLHLFKSKEQFPEVHACAAAVAAAESHLQDLLPSLAAAAGVPELSYVTVQNQGSYLLELPATRHKVPPGWEKVCATKKVCRYHPAEVKSGMAALARAREQLTAACSSTWQQLLLGRFSCGPHYAALRECVAAIAQLDALQALAVVAASPNYCRPEFVEDGEAQQLVITDGKHPMLDLSLDGSAVGNDIALQWDGVRAAVITGPNMGGKSVLIRQAAVTIIMAQVGSWVPAAACRLSVFDGVFTRMGASDCLLQGRSTFAEELGEASHILAAATKRSFVVMDELGRGTATHDGVAIASATLRHLVGSKQCLSLFVTHYPEVAAAAAIHGGSSSSSGKSSSGNSAPGVAGDGVSQHIAVYHMSYVRHEQQQQQQQQQEQQEQLEQQEQQEQQEPVGSSGCSAGLPAAAAAEGTATAAAAGAAGEASVPTITFLYKLAPGAADESFGLNVAQMAGLPAAVVQRAAAVAGQLKRHVAAAGNTAAAVASKSVVPAVSVKAVTAANSNSKTDTDTPLMLLCTQLCHQLRQAAAAAGPGETRADAADHPTQQQEQQQQEQPHVDGGLLEELAALHQKVNLLLCE